MQPKAFFKPPPDCRLVVWLEVMLHCWLEAVTDTEKFCPQVSPGTLHSLESDMHMGEMPVSVCIVAV